MEPVARVGVTVTFLRMDRAPADAAPALPPGQQVVRVGAPSVGFSTAICTIPSAPITFGGCAAPCRIRS